MYDKHIYNLCHRLSVTNRHTFSDPSPSSVTYFMDSPYWGFGPNYFEEPSDIISLLSQLQFKQLLLDHLLIVNK